MENYEKNTGNYRNEESPLDVLKKIVITTIITCAVGWLLYYFGLI